MVCTNANVYNPRSPPPKIFLNVALCSFKLRRQAAEIFHCRRSRHRRRCCCSWRRASRGEPLLRPQRRRRPAVSLSSSSSLSLPAHRRRGGGCGGGAVVRCTGRGRGRPRWWWWKGKGRPRWRWWKRKGLVRCAVVVVEEAVRRWRRREIGDDPDRWGPATRERERRDCWACWARIFFTLIIYFFMKNWIKP